MPSSAPLVKAAIVALIASQDSPGTYASYGDPGFYQVNEIVVAGNQKVQITRPTSANTRPREEQVDTDVIFSVFAPGGPDQQQVATERAYALLGTFADYFKTKPNETLSGACREAWVSAYDLVESISVHPDTDEVVGRVSEITAIVTSHARI
jgi:hypothetical protein